MSSYLGTTSTFFKALVEFSVFHYEARRGGGEKKITLYLTLVLFLESFYDFEILTAENFEKNYLIFSKDY